MNSLYKTWNKELLSYFFPKNSNLSVRLNVDFELLDTQFSHLGGHSAFLTAVNNGPIGINGETLYSTVYNLFRTQQYTPTNEQSKEYQSIVHECDDPPYLPYLILLCLAWQVNSEGIKANAYYPRLEKIYPSHGINAQNFSSWTPIWKGLQKWAKNKKRGKMSLNSLGMPYVGIPRGQVIFTPSKVRSFPAFLSRIRAHRRDDRDSLHRKILSHERSSISFLGNTLYQSVRVDYPDESIGEAAVSQLFEFLEDWDGRQKNRISSGASSCENGPMPIEHNLEHLIRFNKADGLWDVGYAFNNDEFSISESTSDEVYSLGEVMLRNGDYSFIKKNGNFLKKTTIDDLDISLSTEETNVSIDLSSSSNDAIFFNKFLSKRYIVESFEVDQDQGFLLYSKKVSTGAMSWISNYNLETEILRTSCSSHILIHLQNLNSLPPEAWVDYKKFSGVQIDKSQQSHAKIRLRQGTRTSRNSTYLNFDLPSIELLDSHLVVKDSLTCLGGEIIIDTSDSYASQIPDNSVNYKIKADPNTDFVCVQVQFFNETDHQEVCFHIDHPEGNHTEVLQNHTGINKFGRPVDISESAGIRGVECEGITSPATIRFDNSTKPATPAQSSTIELGNSFENNIGVQFITALINESNLKKVSIRLAFELAHRLVDSDSFNRRSFNRQLRYLRDLGYVEIGCDNKNRWTHVIPCSPGLCLLPSKIGNLFCVTIAGSWLFSRLNSTIKKLEEAGFELTVSAKILHEILPPKISILVADLSELEKIIELPIPICSNVSWTPKFGQVVKL